MPDSSLWAPGAEPLLLDKSVSGLGEAVFVHAYPEIVDGEFTGRLHEQYTVELDGHKHSALVTRSSDKYSEVHGYFFAGFSQTTDEPEGPGFTIHTGLAKRMRDVTWISIAPTGVGPIGDHLSKDTMGLATVEAMGEQRFRLMQAISGDLPKLIASLSMGTVISAYAKQHDLDAGQLLNIIGEVKYVPAEVTPDRVLQDMIIGFGKHIIWDVRREITDRRNLLRPRNFIDTLRCLGHAGLGRADAPALVSMMMSLREGIELGIVQNETENYPITIIGGAKDPLTQPKMWHKEEKRNPHNVTLRVIPKRGHGMAVDSEGGSSQVSRQLRRFHPAA